MSVRLASAAAVAVLTLALTGCSSDDGSGTAATPTTETSPTETSPSPSESATAGGTGGPAATRCSYVAGGSAAKKVDPPSAKPTARGQVPVTISTNQGDLHATLDADSAPCTVHSFLSLAEQGYFDDTPCHRLVTSGIYVLQCGDPTGTGTGDPGYTLPDENLPEAKKNDYPAGTVAMANAGPNTGGSQFFIVYRDTTLPPAYTVWGKVTSGLDAVKKIAADGTADGRSDGPPKKPVTITAVTVD